MKTKVILKSEIDRNLYGIIVKQETKTQFLSLTDLQKSYDSIKKSKNWSDKQISKILENNNMRERIFYHLKKQRLIVNSNLLLFMQDVEKQGLIKILKDLGQYKTKGRGENREVWCNTYIWVMIAFEMHPEIYIEVIYWLTDKLIFNREEAGDNWKPLCEIINQKFLLNKSDDVRIKSFKWLAHTLNEKVFGKHKSEIRNIASTIQLKQLNELELQLTNCIRMNYVKSSKQIKEFICNFELN